MSHCESCKQVYFKDDFGGIRDERAICTTDRLVQCPGCQSCAEKDKEIARLSQIIAEVKADPFTVTTCPVCAELREELAQWQNAAGAH